MPVKRTTSLRIGCLMSLLLFLAVGSIIVNRYQNATSCLNSRLPLESFGLTIDPSQRQQLVERSRRFAFENGFRFDVGDFDEHDNDFQIRMVREDVEIITSSSANPGVFEIRFYNYDCSHPTVASEIGTLANDFKSAISEVPSVTVVE